MSIAHKVNGEWLETAGVPPIDTELSSTSTNAVQNRVVTAALGGKADSEAVLNEAKTRGALGAKNLFPPAPRNTWSSSGITVTQNDDGSYTYNGTATADAWIPFSLSKADTATNTFASTKFIKGGTYILSGNTDDSGLWLYFTGRGSDDAQDDSAHKYHTEDSSEIVVTLPDDNYIRVYTHHKSGTVYDNVTIYPMLRLATDADPTYQPYAMTNYELTKAVGESSDYYVEQQVTLSTSGDTTVTFTDSKITTSSVFDIYTSKFGVNATNMTVSTGSCTVTIAKVSTAETITVRLYIK